MAESEVSSMIGDILGAFQNGLNVFRGTTRKHKRRHSEPSRVDEEKLTIDSLSERPLEIKRTYDNLVVKHGREIEVGDVPSQTSLAQTLLVFNTGVIKLLKYSLSDEKKSRSSARSGIFNLSETAAMDTLIALSELDLRLIHAKKLKAKQLALSKVDESSERQKSRPRSSSCGQPMAIRRPPPTPRLQNGGWVRSKSDPSAVSVVVVSKTKKAEQRRGSSSQSPVNSPTSSTVNTSTSKAKEPKSPPPRYSQVAHKSPPQPRPKPAHLQSLPPTSLSTVPESTEKQLVRHPSMYIVPSDFFDAFPASAAPLYEPQSVMSPPPSPPVPPKVPLHSRPQQLQASSQITTKPTIPEEQSLPPRNHYSPQRERRVRPASMMTFMTASTKIGEIPEHHLPDRELTQEEQDQIPMPYVVPAMLGSPKRKARGLKFWKRQERGDLGTITA